MGEEHDSWLSGLGVNIAPSDTSASMKSSAGGVLESGLDALGDAARAGVDFAKGKVEDAGADIANDNAQMLNAFGASGAAKTLRDAADQLHDEADANYQAGYGEFRKAKDDVLGDGPSPKAAPQDPLHAPSRQNGGVAMGPDCKVVRGKVPGPANHVLCGTHGHILDLGTKTIIAGSLDEYKKTYGKGGGTAKPEASGYGGGGGGGGYQSQDEQLETETEAPSRSGGQRIKDVSITQTQEEG